MWGRGRRTLTSMSEEALSTGRIVIEWTRLPSSSGEAPEYDWEIRMEPPGIADDDVERLLREIVDRL